MESFGFVVFTGNIKQQHWEEWPIGSRYYIQNRKDLVRTPAGA